MSKFCLLSVNEKSSNVHKLIGDWLSNSKLHRHHRRGTIGEQSLAGRLNREVLWSTKRKNSNLTGTIDISSVITILLELTFAVTDMASPAESMINVTWINEQLKYNVGKRRTIPMYLMTIFPADTTFSGMWDVFFFDINNFGDGDFVIERMKLRIFMQEVQLGTGFIQELNCIT